MTTKLGFDPQWMALVMECITTPSYVVIINRKPTDYIKPTRGIKQDDSLELMLMLTRKDINSTWVEEAAKGSHLMFAKDDLPFGHATIEECNNIIQISNKCVIV